MRRVSTATCTSGDPVSPSCVRFSWIISAFCSATANFFFLLFVHFSIISPIRLFMLPHAMHRIAACAFEEQDRSELVAGGLGELRYEARAPVPASEPTGSKC